MIQQQSSDYCIGEIFNIQGLLDNKNGSGEELLESEKYLNFIKDRAVSLKEHRDKFVFQLDSFLRSGKSYGLLESGICISGFLSEEAPEHDYSYAGMFLGFHLLRLPVVVHISDAVPASVHPGPKFDVDLFDHWQSFSIYKDYSYKNLFVDATELVSQLFVSEDIPPCELEHASFVPISTKRPYTVTGYKGKRVTFIPLVPIVPPEIRNKISLLFSWIDTSTWKLLI